MKVKAEGSMYQSPGQYPDNQRSGQAMVSPASTAGLLGSVLGITGAGFLITAVASAIFQGAPHGVALIAMLAGFGLLFAISATRANDGLSLLLFYLFAACEGIGIAPVIGGYVRGVGPEIVVEAAATTGLGMLTLGCIAFLASFDFRRWQNLAFGLLIGLVLVGFLSIFVHFLHPQLYDAGGFRTYSRGWSRPLFGTNGRADLSRRHQYLHGDSADPRHARSS
jgi:FtsH-binding integral membrane protein